MKYFGSLLLAGFLIVGCTKEIPRLESTTVLEDNSDQRIPTEEESPTLTVSLELSQDDFIETLDAFEEEYQTNENYVYVVPNLEELTLTFSIVPFLDGVPDDPTTPFGAMVVQCGADGSNSAAVKDCKRWAHDLMKLHGCCMLSYGYNDDGSCYSTTLDC